MKSKVFPIILYCATIGLLSFVTADEYAVFGISGPEVGERLWSAFVNNATTPYFGDAVRDACKAIPAERQAAAVRKAGDLFKSYFQSGDFKEKHKSWLMHAFQQESTGADAASLAGIRERKLKEIQPLKAADLEMVVDIYIQAGESMTSMEGMLGSLPKEQQAEFKKQIESARHNAAYFKKIKPLLSSDFPAFQKQYADFLAREEIAASDRRIADTNARNAAEYEQWKDTDKILKQRISGFLERTKNIDFAAQTRDVNGRRKFVNGAYEAKDNVWKFCYRMGPAPTLAAREYAQQWLTELK
ncbi:hypothetical protein [Dyadobacter sandarakinus]|uniref:Uncharacterized protein n=1 Tax=Dyadobacter sandarakinus TaxID=2747268 RepID=A0ABX7IB65_9BACT|nr:hypothetical protein [Dyadobacter sandarakinus]QRR02181.1 hypothetical protein HWI92_15335 [Dyadobacter sandarakinus]